MVLRNVGRSIWPNWSISDLYRGQTGKVLESLCDPSICRYDRLLGWSGLPWLFWATENHSFGRCYREWLGWPRWLPIPVYGDHGVALDSILEKNEIENPAKHYLVFYLERFNNLTKRRDKHFFQVPHPWIYHRRINNIFQNPDARGTIIFFPHSTRGSDIEFYDFDEYFDELKQLSGSFKPLVICMHMMDVMKGYHHKISKHEIPIVTAGNTNSQYFVDRFYDLVRNFEYATSNTGGSELFLCTELGVNYFIYGETPVYVNKSYDEAPLGIQTFLDELGARSFKIKNDLFRAFPPTVNTEKREFTAEVLGLNVDQMAARRYLRDVFITETFRLFSFYCFQVFSDLLTNIYGDILRFCVTFRSNGLVAFLRKLKMKVSCSNRAAR